MTEEELATLATQIMGWHRDEQLMVPTSGDSEVEDITRIVWRDPNGIFMNTPIGWHPDTDIKQAFMLVDAIGKMDGKYREVFLDAFLELLIADAQKDRETTWFFFGMNNEERASLLAHAALEVAKSLAAKKMLEAVE